MKIYQVGGSVRDELLGLKSKDLDYVCVCESYDAMKQAILDKGGKIYLEKPEYLTIRAKVNGLGDADFVMARKDGNYYDGRRPESVVPGTLKDDILRRDFTINALAKDCETGHIIDMVGGQDDLKKGIIRCVGSTKARFEEDGLRILRAIRFTITRFLKLSNPIHRFLTQRDTNLEEYLKGVSTERIREELNKMLKVNTYGTLYYLVKTYPKLHYCIFGVHQELWLKPTTEQ